MVITWFSILFTLSVIQVFFYHLTFRKLSTIAIAYGAVLYWVFVTTEVLRRVFTAWHLMFLTNIAVCLAAALIGELFSVLFRREGKVMEKQDESLPSFFGLTVLYLTLGWLGARPPVSLIETHLMIVSIIFLDVLILFILTGICERLLLADIPHDWHGLPILLVSSAILLLMINGFVNFIR